MYVLMANCLQVETMMKVATAILLVVFIFGTALSQKRSPRSVQPQSEYERKVEMENKKHNWGEGQLKVGDPAPEFDLKMLDAQDRVRLSSFAGKKPVALIMGSYTCPLFRGEVATLNEMARMYKDKVEFLLIYIREAHPVESWPDETNKREGILLPDASSIADKEGHASMCVQRLDIKFTTLIDEMDNRVELAYTAWPDRLYLIGKNGRIAWKGRPGAVGFVPAELAVAIEATLER